MKLKTINTLKRSVSAVSAMAMAVSVLPAVNTYAVTGTTHYDLDGYSIDYTVTNEWIGHQNVSVKLTNTSDEPILNWALGYDAHGDVENIWNGNVSSKDDNGYIIKNAGYNYEIAPGSSVSYGYTLSGIDLSVPDSFEVLSKRVNKANGYVVNYNKLSDWGQGFQGEIVVLNTSSEPLEAWTVGFDSSFEINSLWGGRIISHEDSHYEIAAESWTNPIAPDSQVTIGFIGASNGDASISNKSLSTVVTGRNADNTEKPELSVSASGEYVDGSVELAWDSTANNGVYEVFYSTDNVEYASVGTTKKEIFTFTPDSDVNGDVYFKIKQTAKDGRIAESSVVVVNIPAPVIKITPELSVTAEYDTETGYINAAWETTVSDGSFKVVVSLGDEEISSCDIKDTNSFSFKPEKSGEYLIKVTQTTETGMTATRSVSVNAVVSDNTESDPDINWEDETDTDNDGLPDVYELNYFNTDPNKAVTDEDELPDGYEVMNLGTDPAKADSDENGITDADEDADEDKLTNKEEYTLGTNPVEKDTDQDRLSDYDEVKIHGTDPLKYDTDGDSISDGDEIALGLDPLNPATDGTPDSEHTFVQHIGVESDAFAKVNTAENPFKVSIDIECAGVAENNLYSKESGYSNAISNPAILGLAPEFEYTDGLDVKDVVINFDIESAYTSNVDGSYAAVNGEFVGIKRLNVFKFFEDTNMLLPIETFHDVENNRVYTHVDELGTYCLMDMEKWFASLDVKADEFKTEAMAMNTLSGISSSRAMTMNKLASIKSDGSKGLDEPIDIFVVPYAKNVSDLVIDELDRTVKDIFQKNNNVHLYLVSPIGGLIGDDYVTDYDSASSLITRVPDLRIYSNPDSYMLSKAARTVSEYSHELRDESNKFCFVIDAFANPSCTGDNAYIAAAINNGVEFYFERSRVNDNDTYYSGLSGKEPHVIQAEPGRYNFGDYIIDVLFGDYEIEYPIISATGWSTIKLNSTLQQNYEWYKTDKPYNEWMDTDLDGLADYQEIKFKRDNGISLINDADPNNIGLYNFAEVIELSADRYNYDYNSDKLFYVVNGLERICKDLDCDEKYPLDLLNVRILPINSNPNSQDSDGDGYYDKDDCSKLQNNYYRVTLASNNGNYLKVYYNGIEADESYNSGYRSTMPNYGGSQMWFLDTSSETQRKIKNNEPLSEEEKYNYKLEHEGCGVIAITDLLVYLSIYHDDFNKREYCSISSNHIPYSKYDDYSRYIASVTGTNLNGIALVNWFNTISKCDLYHDVGIHYSPILFWDKDTILTCIENSLINDYPLIISIFYDKDNELLFFPYDESTKDNYPETEIDSSGLTIIKGTSDRVYDYGEHYAIVTEVINNDNSQHKVSLVLSSWGQKYIIDFEDFLLLSKLKIKSRFGCAIYVLAENRY